MSNLTDKQEKFVQGLVKGLTQREAYKQSYDAENMNDNVIDVRASELFAKSKLRVRYNELRNKIIKESERKTVADAVEIMEFWTRVVRSEETDEIIILDPKNGVVKTEQKVDTRTRLEAAKQLAKRYGLDKQIGEIANFDMNINIVTEESEEDE